MEGILKDLFENIWSCQIKYLEKEKQYKFSYRFALFQGHNIISLFFDEKGTFVKIKPYVIHKHSNATLKETEQDHIEEALEVKKDVERILQKLIRITSFENLRIKEEAYDLDEDYLTIDLDLENLVLTYDIDINNPLKTELNYKYSNSRTGIKLCPFLENIPSLKGLEGAVLNHAQLRVKYVNELARYQKNRV